MNVAVGLKYPVRRKSTTGVCDVDVVIEEVAVVSDSEEVGGSVTVAVVCDAEAVRDGVDVETFVAEVKEATAVVDDLTTVRDVVDGVRMMGVALGCTSVDEGGVGGGGEGGLSAVIESGAGGGGLTARGVVCVGACVDVRVRVLVLVEGLRTVNFSTLFGDTSGLVGRIVNKIAFRRERNLTVPELSIVMEVGVLPPFLTVIESQKTLLQMSLISPVARMNFIA